MPLRQGFLLFALPFGLLKKTAETDTPLCFSCFFHAKNARSDTNAAKNDALGYFLAGRFFMFSTFHIAYFMRF